jgi:hypothetical protein
MKGIPRNILLCFAASGTLLLNACDTPSPRQALSLDQGAFAHHIPAVYLMPVIDARDDKSVPFDDADRKRLRDMTKSRLDEHGYQVILVDSWGAGMPPSDQTLADMSNSELAALAPSDSGVFFVISVNDATDASAMLATSCSITVTLTAIDRLKKAAIWEDADIGTAGGFDAVHSASSLAAKRSYVQNAVLMQLFESCPNNPK